MTDIATMQGYNTYVDFIPQNILEVMSPGKAAGNHFRFTVVSPAGNVVQILKSSDLHTWTSQGYLTNTNGTNVFTDTNVISGKLFYRASD
jgi:hypothetical protein